MKKFTCLLYFIVFCFCCYASDKDTIEIKTKKLEYNDFIVNYSNNDTCSAIVNIFFDKQNNYAKGQMSFFPITAAIFPLFPLLSVGVSSVSLPMFINGSIVLVKYRKKKLRKVLIGYNATSVLPNWVRKKVNKSLDFGRFDEE